LSYLAIVKAAESRMRMERDPGAILSNLYRTYWSTPETDPLETFTALHREIDHLEQQVGADTAWRTLEEAAKRWYQEKARCPFCGKDELHLSGRG
jgi:aspartate aminotransferase-like enzyme